MASPQKGNGYTSIAHEILEASSKYMFNGSQYAILLIIWRMTYGWKGSKHNRFATTFLSQATGLTQNTVAKELRLLIEKKVLIVVKEATNKEARRLGFNKDYDQWGVERRGKPVQQELFDYADQDTPDYADQDTQSNENPYLEYANRDTNIERSTSLKKVIKENVDVLFNDFYQAYPRKISKAAALKSWSKLSKKADFDPTRIIVNTLNYAETCKLLQTETKYIPHPSTYLNQERFADYPFIDPEGLSTSLSNGSGKYSKSQQKDDVLLNAFMEAAASEENGTRVIIQSNQGMLPKF